VQRGHFLVQAQEPLAPLHTAGAGRGGGAGEGTLPYLVLRGGG
jgi:hypothetical protein